MIGGGGGGDQEKQEPPTEIQTKILTLCKMPFWKNNNHPITSTSSSSSSNTTSTSTSSSSITTSTNNSDNNIGDGNVALGLNQRQQQNQSSHLQTVTSTVSFVTKSLLPTRRRLRLDPPTKLYFPYEPGKQVRSAVGIKNICKSYAAFKFQTTSPKSCYMRPPGAILAPGESLIATVFKFVEPPENNERPVEQRFGVKFKIMSLKVKGQMEYVPEMFDELKDQVAVEQILKVVFLDPECPNPALEKLKRQLAEAEAELEARKKPPSENTGGSRALGEGLIIDEWKERRERYLAQQQIELDSL